MNYQPGFSVMKQLVAHAGKVTPFGPKDIAGPTKSQDVFRVRCAVIAAARQRGLSFNKIARQLNRDHSTIIEATRSMEKFRADPEWNALVEELS